MDANLFLQAWAEVWGRWQEDWGFDNDLALSARLDDAELADKQMRDSEGG